MCRGLTAPWFHFLHIHVSLSSLTSYLAETVNPKTTFPRWLCRLDGHCGLDFTKKMHSVNLWNEESNTRPLPLLRRRAFPAWHWGSLLWQWWQRSWLMSWARLWMGSHPFQLLHLAMGHPNGVPRAFLRPCQLPNTLNKFFFFLKLCCLNNNVNLDCKVSEDKNRVIYSQNHLPFLPPRTSWAVWYFRKKGRQVDKQEGLKEEKHSFGTFIELECKSVHKWPS